MDCNGPMKDKKTVFILTCIRKLILCYLSKGFVILEIKSHVFRYVPKRVNQNIHAEDLHMNVPSATNTLKNIHLSSDLYNNFTSTFYDDNFLCWVFL